MAKKTASPTPCCNTRVSLGDGLRLIACPKCGKAWQTYTGQGHVTFNEPSTDLLGPKIVST